MSAGFKHGSYAPVLFPYCNSYLNDTINSASSICIVFKLVRSRFVTIQSVVCVLTTQGNGSYIETTNIPGANKKGYMSCSLAFRL